MFVCKLAIILTLTSSLYGVTLENLLESNSLLEIFRGKKIGYYVGSFDPIHKGHKDFAEGVIKEGICDYVIICPAWGKDQYKKRTPISLRLEMLQAAFFKSPKIIISQLSPLDMQKALTIPNDKTIKRYCTVKPLHKDIQFIGLIGSDTALDLCTPSSDNKKEINRKKKLQIFLRGVKIPEKYAKSTIGTIMALPVSSFVVAIRNGDIISSLNGMIGNRPICNIYTNNNINHASSTLVKKRLQKNDSTEDLLEPKVLTIIQEAKIYKQHSIEGKS